MFRVISPVQAAALQAERQNLRRFWPVFLLLGIAMVGFGTAAISWACLTTLTIAAMWLFGWLLMAGGVAEIISAFWAGRWSGMVVHLLIGVLYAFVGFLFVDRPAASAVELTLIISIFMIVGGIFRIVFALGQKFHGSGWVLLNGVATLVLGVLIYKQWPASGLWVIGLFLGIEMIFNGWAWIMLAAVLRKPAEGPASGLAAAA